MTRSEQHHNDDLTRLLIRAGRDDTRAFERLHAALLPIIGDYLASLGGSIDYHRRQDLVQEVLFRTWRNLSRFRGEASAKTFVLAIAKRVLQEERLRRAKLPITHIDNFDHFASAYLSDTSASQTDRGQSGLLEEIRRAVAQLPAVQREAFDLVHLQDMPMSEAAKVANCSIQQFWDRLYRARKQLKKLLRKLPRGIVV